tara:strand:+ start:4356 stop:5021 length:666 start_codon:yes stop_codon:yes gene_type:complete
MDLPTIKPRRMPSLFLAIVPLFAGAVALLMLSEQSLESLIYEATHLGPLNWRSVFAALFCGGILGWERQLRGKPIGMRTSMLVCLGSYIFVAVSIHMTGNMPDADARIVTDPSRIIGQIVSGIGFLGAGVMFTKKGSVNGVTSAATVWLLASIGVCIGVDAIATAIKVSTLGAVVLIVVDSFDDVLADMTKLVFHHKSRYAGELVKRREHRKAAREESYDE